MLQLETSINLTKRLTHSLNLSVSQRREERVGRSTLKCLHDSLTVNMRRAAAVGGEGISAVHLCVNNVMHVIRGWQSN